MRILHCIPSFGRGGTERRLSYLAAEQAQSSHEVHIAFMYDGPNRGRLSLSGVTLYQIRAAGNYDPRILFGLVQIMRISSPDIVQTWLTQMDIFGGLAANLSGCPFIVSEASSEQAYPTTWKNALRGWIARSAGAIISNSVGGETYWRRRLPRTLRYVIPNGLPFEEIEATLPCEPSDLGIDSPGRLILNVGMFRHEKNLLNMVRALALVMPDLPAIAVLCGDGPVRPAIQELGRELGMARCLHFLAESVSVWSLMKRADVLVAVSKFEGRPNAVIEAMACGCPLVVSDIPAHREVVDEDCAYFVEPSDPSDIARGIRCALRFPEEAKRKAERAKVRTAPWSVQAMAKLHDNAYTDVLARGR